MLATHRESTAPRISVMLNMTIKSKLIAVLMLTSIVALLLAATAFLILEWTSVRQTMVRNLSIQAKMIADNCKAALAFEDVKDAEETLQALRAEPSIVLGCVRTNDGKIFASYHRDATGSTLDQIGSGAGLSEFQERGHIFAGGCLTLSRRIVLDKVTIGTVCLRSDLHPMYAMLKRNTQIIAGVLLFCSLATLLVSSWLQGVISRPILSLAEVAKVVSEKKDYSTRAPRQSSDEVGLLIDAFNQMLDQIQQRDLALVSAKGQLEIRVGERTAELTAANEQLVQEIADRQKAEHALESSNKDLESTVQDLSRSNKELKDFAHIIAHDLKAPLRAVGTLADWISTDYADRFDEQGRGQMKLLKGRVMRMNELIDSVLRYAEIGRVTHDRKEVNLNTLITEVVDQIGPPENIEIIIENELPTVVCEKIRLVQIFQNLLGNAVKYMGKPQGRIRIGCVEEDDLWKFSVSDNGPGIAEEYFEKIFKILQTLSPRDELESTGIGLSVVKKIVETYGGRIWVESKVGEGTTFFFTLPKQETRPKDAKLEPDLACRR